MELTDLYEELGVSHTATEREISDAIREQERTWRRRQNAPKREQRATAEAKLEMLGEARKVLLNPESRQAYDDDLASNKHSPGPDLPHTPTQADPEEWMMRAEVYLAELDWRSANYAARQACDAAPDNARAWELRARSSAGLRNQHDADFEFQEAVQRDPLALSAYIGWSQSRQFINDWAGALDILRRAAEVKPGDYEVLRNTAICYLGTGDPESGLRVAEQLKAEFPNLPGTSDFLARMLMEVALSKLTLGQDGSYYITSPSQAEYLSGLLDYALTLEIDDTQTRTEIENWRFSARKSLRRQFSSIKDAKTWIIVGVTVSLLVLLAVVTSSSIRAFPLFVLSGFGGLDLPDLPSYAMVMLIIVAPIFWAIGAFYSQHWIPQWQLHRRTLKATGAARWGTDTPVALPIAVEASRERP